MRNFLILTTLLFNTLVWAQNKPEATFTEKGKQLGEVKEGTLLKTVYMFTNTGDRNLILQKVEPSCGCTVAEYPKYPIQPGAKDSIVVTFDTHDRVGYQAKGINIESNAGPINLVFEVMVIQATIKTYIGEPFINEESHEGHNHN
ncbi:DUF1573 domain-containing protein [Bacteroidia bacterium]|nr:DUF1573 domain-containing protein [Bacteroidia bacterium]